MTGQLKGQKVPEPDFFDFEINWVWQNNDYPFEAKESDLSKAAGKIFSSFCVDSAEY